MTDDDPLCLKGDGLGIGDALLLQTSKGLFAISQCPYRPSPPSRNRPASGAPPASFTYSPRQRHVAADAPPASPQPAAWSLTAGAVHLSSPRRGQRVRELEARGGRASCTAVHANSAVEEAPAVRYCEPPPNSPPRLFASHPAFSASAGSASSRRLAALVEWRKAGFAHGALKRRGLIKTATQAAVRGGGEQGSRSRCGRDSRRRRRERGDERSGDPSPREREDEERRLIDETMDELKSRLQGEYAQRAATFLAARRRDAQEGSESQLDQYIRSLEQEHEENEERARDQREAEQEQKEMERAERTMRKQRSRQGGGGGGGGDGQLSDLAQKPPLRQEAQHWWRPMPAHHEAAASAFDRVHLAKTIRAVDTLLTANDLRSGGADADLRRLPLYQSALHEVLQTRYVAIDPTLELFDGGRSNAPKRGKRERAHDARKLQATWRVDDQGSVWRARSSFNDSRGFDDSEATNRRACESLFGQMMDSNGGRLRRHLLDADAEDEREIQERAERAEPKRVHHNEWNMPPSRLHSRGGYSRGNTRGMDH